MKHKQNLHTHTTYVDGKDRPEEILLRALERGMEGIGFSEHAYIPYSEYPRQLTAEKMEQYRDEILDLKKKYAGRIDVFCGLEYDFYSELEADRMDYLIGSITALRKLWATFATTLTGIPCGLLRRILKPLRAFPKKRRWTFSDISI